MLRDYVLSREVVNRGNFDMANVSMAIKHLEEGYDYMKFGGTTVLNKSSPRLPLYIRSVINDNLDKFSDLSKLISIQYIEDMTEKKIIYYNNRFLLKSIIKKYYHHINRCNSLYSKSIEPKVYMSIDRFKPSINKGKQTIYSKLLIIKNKKFIELETNIFNVISSPNYIKVTCTYKELLEFKKEKLIDGYWRITKRKYLVWYRV